MSVISNKFIWFSQIHSLLLDIARFKIGKLLFEIQLSSFSQFSEVIAQN